MAWILIIILLTVFDQITKIIIRTNIGKNQGIEVIENFFYITHRTNKGAAWSFLANKDWGIYALAVISFVASCVMIYLIFKSQNKRFSLVISVICAGSIGNFIDRAFLGGVTDFLEFHFGSYIFPTFNVADSLIVCGSAAMILLMIFDKHFLSDFVEKEK